jgi:hypothetical protein
MLGHHNHPGNKLFELQIKHLFSPLPSFPFFLKGGPLKNTMRASIPNAGVYWSGAYFCLEIKIKKYTDRRFIKF